MEIRYFFVVNVMDLSSSINIVTSERGLLTTTIHQHDHEYRLE